jgi:hypothetical protein
MRGAVVSLRSARNSKFEKNEARGRARAPGREVRMRIFQFYWLKHKLNFAGAAGT